MQKSEVEAEIVDVSEYLSLKLLGRDAKVKASEEVFDATKWASPNSLFAISNKLGWFVAGTPTGLIASPLSHLRELQTNATGDGPAPLEPKRRVQLSGAPYFVHFATSHTRVVVVVQADGEWVLEIFNAEDICKEGSGEVKPAHTFPLGKEDVVDMQPNPSEDSEVVAILRGRKSSSSCLDMINIASASRVTSWGAANQVDEGTAFTCISWSVRGKQIVVGTRGGELAQFTPEGERKQTIPPPPSHSSPQAVVSILWLENTVFHVVYGNPDSDPADPTHDYEVFNILFDSKAKTASYVKFTDPAPPFGVASRLACRHYARLVSWEPTKHLIFVADGPSTDVGALACLSPSEAEGKPTPWATLEVDETSRISLPMDDDLNETSIMGIDLDLTSTDPISNSQEAGDDAAPSPPSPILHLYTSAGLIISYHVLNSRGGKYPGMGASEVPSVVSPVRPATPPSTTPVKPSGFGAFGAGASAFGAKPGGAFGQPPTTPAFGSSSFGSTTPAGAPAFGVSTFGGSTTPAKPNPFGQPSTTPAAAPAFGQTSAFGSSAFGGGGGFGKFAAAPSTTPAGAPPAGGGFAGFGSKPAGFGASGGTNIFASTETTTPKPEGGLSAFGSSAFGTSTTPSKPAGGFAGFGPPATTTPKVEVKPRDQSIEADSPSGGATKPLQIDDDDKDISPPGSPGGQSDNELDVDNLDLGGGGGKKVPAGLNLSDDEEEHDPTETPSKPPVSTSAFAGFGKPSAFGNVSGGGAFAVPSSSTGVVAPASGFGAFGSKPSAPSPGFGFGTSTKPQDDKSGQPAKPAFGGGAAFGSTTAFGSSAFGAAKPAPAFGAAPAFGTTSTPGAASTPTFGAPSAFGATSTPAFGAPSTFGAAAKPASDSPTESPAPKSGGFGAFASKPGESKGATGFAGFGDAAKSSTAGGFGAFAKPSDTKSGGFAGFGDAGKKNIFDEKPAEQAKPEESDKKEEVKEDKPSTPKEEKEEVKEEVKPEPAATTPLKSAFGLTVSSPPPKPKQPSPPSESKPTTDVPSKIPVPKPSLLDRLSPKPESAPESAPEEPSSTSTTVPGTPETPRSETSTPPGSPARAPSPPTTVPPKTTSAPIPSPFGLGKPPMKPFGATPLRSSPLASPPVTRENDARQEEFAKATPVAPPALAPKTSSSSLFGAAKAEGGDAKPASTGFFGFGKPAAEPPKDTKAGAEQWPSSFSGAMKGVGPASVTAGSPAVVASSVSTSTPAPPAARTGSPFSAPLAPAPKPASPAPAAASAAPAAATGAPTTKPSLFGTPSASPAPPPTFSGFGPKPPSGPGFSFGGAGSTPSAFGASTPSSSTPPPAPSLGFASFKTPAPAPVASPAAPAATVPSSVPVAPSGAPPALWSNVEVEFNKLLEQMANELGKMRQDTAALRHRHAVISQASIPPQPPLQSTQVPGKWTLGDLTALKHVTNQVAREVEPLKGLNKDFAAQMTELQPGAEKVQAKRNEIARYIKAKKDPKYTRLLKSRTSSPEHIESQTKLRKSLQIVRERTRQLETFMATQRSRIQKQKEGRREFKVPSIDTINRTMRNIDSALSQKSDEITQLTARVDRMKLKAPKHKGTSGTVALVLPAAENEKIKLASAAALNMERSSVRLKAALLQARKETPLNTSAVGAPVETKPGALAKVLPPRAPAVVPSTPSSTSIFPPATPAAASTPAPALPMFGQSTPFGQPTTPGPFTPAAPAKTPMLPGGFVLPPVTPTSLPSFSPLGKDEFHVTSGYEHASRRSEKSRMHGSSAKFNKTPSPSLSRTDSTPPAKSFFGAPPAETPSITPAKSFFGVGPAPPLFGGERKPQPLPVFSVPPTPPKATKGFSFFPTPEQKAGGSTSTPAPLAKWAQPASPSQSPKPNGAAAKKAAEEEDGEDGEGDEEEGSEGQHSGDDDFDEEDDEDWEPGDDDEEDEEEVSDGVPEDDGEEEDQTARV